MVIYRHSDGVVPNTLAFVYVLVGYPLAIWILGFSGSALGASFWLAVLWLLAVVYLAHVLVIAAYLLHECAHNTIFHNAKVNERAGEALTFLVGASYSAYSRLRQKHLRHHIERADVVLIDTQQLLHDHPLLLKICRAMSLCYIPSKELLTHGLSVLLPFLLPEQKQRLGSVLLTLIVRIALFVALASWNLAALIGYGLAYVIFVALMGFMDCYQHDYQLDVRSDGSAVPPQQDRDYEENHTFSNLLSQRFPVLNLLVLNFCYHNIHHQKPNEPWYRLPTLHWQHYGRGEQPVMSLADQLRAYSRYRLQRLTGEGEGAVTGADGVSFLVGV